MRTTNTPGSARRCAGPMMEATCPPSTSTRPSRPTAGSCTCTVHRMVGSYTDAEDLVQETLLRAWRNQDTFESGTNLRAWLYRIATNVCIDTIRASHRQVPAGSELAEVTWLEPYPDVALDQIAATDDAPDSGAVGRVDDGTGLHRRHPGAPAAPTSRPGARVRARPATPPGSRRPRPDAGRGRTARAGAQRARRCAAGCPRIAAAGGPHSATTSAPSSGASSRSMNSATRPVRSRSCVTTSWRPCHPSPLPIEVWPHCSATSRSLSVQAAWVAGMPCRCRPNRQPAAACARRCRPGRTDLRGLQARCADRRRRTGGGNRDIRTWLASATSDCRGWSDDLRVVTAAVLEGGDNR